MNKEELIVLLQNYELTRKEQNMLNEEITKKYDQIVYLQTMEYIQSGNYNKIPDNIINILLKILNRSISTVILKTSNPEDIEAILQTGVRESGSGNISIINYNGDEIIPIAYYVIKRDDR